MHCRPVSPGFVCLLRSRRVSIARCLVPGLLSLLLAGVGCAASQPAVRADDPGEHAGAAEDQKQSTRFRFLSAEEAARFLGEADGFTRALSDFDRSIRLKTPDAVSDAAFRAFAAKEARAFDADEKQALRKHFAAIETAAAALSLSLPAQVLVIQTTGNEELGAAGYTRRNAIVLREAKDRPVEERFRIGLVAHELFHVLSSSSPALRKRAYALVGFHACTAGPIPADIEATRLTNPDAFEASCAMISRGPEVGSRFPVLTVGASLEEALAEQNLFNALKVRLLPEAGTSDEASPWLSTETNFHDKLAKNSGYTIHPEEMLADNFSLWVRAQGAEAKPIPDQAFLDRFVAALVDSSR